MTRSQYGIQLYAMSATSPVNWRLLSGNNRECGRGALAAPDLDSCLRSIAALRSELARGSWRNRRKENRWTWELELDDRPVAVAGRNFDRLVRCEQARLQFVTELPEARVRAGLVLSGARRWGSAVS